MWKTSEMVSDWPCYTHKIWNLYHHCGKKERVMEKHHLGWWFRQNPLVLTFLSVHIIKPPSKKTSFSSSKINYSYVYSTKLFGKESKYLHIFHIKNTLKQPLDLWTTFVTVFSIIVLWLHCNREILLQEIAWFSLRGILNVQFFTF